MLKKFAVNIIGNKKLKSKIILWKLRNLWLTKLVIIKILKGLKFDIIIKIRNVGIRIINKYFNRRKNLA